MEILLVVYIRGQGGQAIAVHVKARIRGPSVAESNGDRHRLLLIHFFPSASTHLPDTTALHFRFCSQNISEVKYHFKKAMSYE